MAGVSCWPICWPGTAPPARSSVCATARPAGRGLSWFDHGLVAALWIGFALVHSLLAAVPVKAALTAWLGRFYRLSYNLFAVVHSGLTWLLAEHWLGRAGQIFDRPAGLEVAQTAGFALGAVLMVVGLRGYDLGRFAGTAQLAVGSAERDLRVDEPLRTDGLHRYVRHPLYSAGFLLLWGRVSGEAALATALWLSGYLLIGTWLEERKLLQAYGAAYADYRARVPAFLPWRGRAI